MTNEEAKSKLKMQDIFNELINLKKYNSDLHNNVRGEKLENYLNELDKSILKAQNKAEDIYTKNFKQ